jgi:hypothetical protein
MPQTVAQLLDQAARQIGELQANQSLDSDTVNTVMWPIARDLLNSFPGHVTGTAEVMFEQSVAAATALAAGNVRLSCTTTCTVTLPAAPRDGWRIVVAYVAAGQTLTIAPNGRKIAGGTASATVAAGATAEYLYRADLSDWVYPLVAATSDMVPWPDEWHRGLAAMLAVEVSNVLGIAPKIQTLLTAASEEKRMIGRYFRKNPGLAQNFRYQAIPTTQA